jgi:hypothetical protein
MAENGEFGGLKTEDVPHDSFVEYLSHWSTDTYVPLRNCETHAALGKHTFPKNSPS